MPPCARTHSLEASETILRHRRHRDKALLIGLEYRVHDGPETVAPLTGIHEDIRQFEEHLIEHEFYEPENITVLLDDGVGLIRGHQHSASQDADPVQYKLNKPNRQTIVSSLTLSPHADVACAHDSLVAARVPSSR